MTSRIYFCLRHFTIFFILLMCFFLYVAAGMTQTGWFFLIASFVIGFLIVTFIATWMNPSGIVLSRRMGSTCYQGERMKVILRLASKKKRNSFVLIIKDPLPLKCSEKGEWALLSVSFLSPNAVHAVAYDLVADFRGVYELGDIFLESCFPFSLFFREIRFREEGKLTVYPVGPYIGKLTLDPGKVSKQTHLGEEENSKGFGDANFRGIREHVSSDGLRRVFWSKTASTGKLLVKEFSGTNPRLARIAVFLDRGYWTSVGKFRQTPLEYIVKLAASICEYAHRNHIQMDLLMLDEEGNLQIQTPDYTAALTYLASLESNRQQKKVSYRVDSGNHPEWADVFSFICDPDLSAVIPGSKVVLIQAPSFDPKLSKKEKEQYALALKQLPKDVKIWKELSKDDELDGVFH